MKTIKYIKGDITKPVVNGLTFIPHCVNDLGVMGAGVAKALYQKWPVVKTEYQAWAQEVDFILGNIQCVLVAPDIVVVNAIGQHGIVDRSNLNPIRYWAIRACMEKLAEVVLKNGGSVHAPKLGAGLAGGNWFKIEKIINETLCAKDIDVTIYEI